MAGLLSSFVPFISSSPQAIYDGLVVRRRSASRACTQRGPLAPFTIHCFSSTLRRLRLWVGFERCRDMSQSTETLGNVLDTVLLRIVGLGSICCDQSAVSMRLAARLASINLTLLPRTSTTSRTTDSEYLFWAELFLHGVDIAWTECPKLMCRNGQSWTVLAITYPELCTQSLFDTCRQSPVLG